MVRMRSPVRIRAAAPENPEATGFGIFCFLRRSFAGRDVQPGGRRAVSALGHSDELPAVALIEADVVGYEVQRVHAQRGHVAADMLQQRARKAETAPPWLHIQRADVGGEVAPDSALPSIRYMAKELGVGIITVKRAYDDLCAEGWCYSLQGKGVFASPLRDSAERKFTDELTRKLKDIADYAAASGVGIDKLIQILNDLKGE